MKTMDKIFFSCIWIFTIVIVNVWVNDGKIITIPDRFIDITMLIIFFISVVF